MSLHLFTIEEKIKAVDIEIAEFRNRPRPPGSANARHWQVLKSIAQDLRAQQQLPRNQVLGELERSLERVKIDRPEESGHYDANRIRGFFNLFVARWPIVRQALEHYGELSAE
jgi:hypothetical protein